MVRTVEMQPSPALQPYIRSFTYREFETHGEDLVKPLPAYNELEMLFMLSGSVSAADLVFKNLTPNHRNFIIGMQTGFKGCAFFRGNIRLLSILFQPGGFFQLYGTPPKLVTDSVYPINEIIPGELKFLEEELSSATSTCSLKDISEKYFLRQLYKKGLPEQASSICATSTLIYHNPAAVSIRQLASHANMSLRSYENKFTEQVGLGPKLYARITRFNNVLKCKMYNEKSNWTDISHKCGYYDQMHFIRDFKMFAGDTPGNFYRNTPMPHEELCHEE